MPYITFTEDVTLDSEPEGTGPHYRVGYSPDVPDGVARYWVSKGAAVFGKLENVKSEVAISPNTDISEEQEDASAEEPAPEEELPPVPKRQTRKRWSPLDSE